MFYQPPPQRLASRRLASDASSSIQIPPTPAPSRPRLITPNLSIHLNVVQDLDSSNLDSSNILDDKYDNLIGFSGSDNDNDGNNGWY